MPPNCGYVEPMTDTVSRRVHHSVVSAGTCGLPTTPPSTHGLSLAQHAAQSTRAMTPLLPAQTFPQTRSWHEATLTSGGMSRCGATGQRSRRCNTTYRPRTKDKRASKGCEAGTSWVISAGQTSKLCRKLIFELGGFGDVQECPAVARQEVPPQAILALPLAMTCSMI
jgi:hypothetical protein